MRTDKAIRAEKARERWVEFWAWMVAGLFALFCVAIIIGLL